MYAYKIYHCYTVASAGNCLLISTNKFENIYMVLTGTIFLNIQFMLVHMHEFEIWYLPNTRNIINVLHFFQEVFFLFYTFLLC